MRILLALLVLMWGVSCAPAATVHTPPVTQWEYLLISTSDLPYTLEHLGFEGWELVHLELEVLPGGIPRFIGILKRGMREPPRQIERLERSEKRFESKVLRNPRRGLEVGNGQ